MRIAGEVLQAVSEPSRFGPGSEDFTRYSFREMLPFVMRLFCQLAAMYNHFLFIYGKMYIELVRVSQEDLPSLSYVPTRYSTMAPDSQRVRPVFGSMIAGKRPLGLMAVNHSSLGSSTTI